MVESSKTSGSAPKAKSKSITSYFAAKTAKPNSRAMEQEKKFHDELIRSKTTSSIFFPSKNVALNPFFTQVRSQAVTESKSNANPTQSIVTESATFPRWQHITDVINKTPKSTIFTTYQILPKIRANTNRNYTCSVSSPHSIKSLFGTAPNYKYEYLVDILEGYNIDTTISRRSLWTEWQIHSNKKISSIQSIHNIPAMNIINVDDDNPLENTHKTSTRQNSLMEPILSSTQTEAVDKVKLWLSNWIQQTKERSNIKSNTKKNTKRKSWLVDDPSDDDIYDYDSSNEGSCTQNTSPTIMILCGPSGTGKSNLVYQCASAIGAGVIEINPGQSRSGSLIKKLILEATKSHGIATTTTSTTINSSQSTGVSTDSDLNIIFFDEVDIVFPEDQGFHAAIVALAKHSRRPIILTSELPAVALPALKPYAEELIMHQPSHHAVVLKLMHYLESLNVVIEKESISILVELSNKDIRSCENTVQLLQSIETSVNSEYTTVSNSSNSSVNTNSSTNSKNSVLKQESQSEYTRLGLIEKYSFMNWMCSTGIPTALLSNLETIISTNHILSTTDDNCHQEKTAQRHLILPVIQKVSLMADDSVIDTTTSTISNTDINMNINYSIRIEGCHFLQRNIQPTSPTSPVCQVDIILEGSSVHITPLPADIISDTLLTVWLPRNVVNVFNDISCVKVIVLLGGILRSDLGSPDRGTPYKGSVDILKFPFKISSVTPWKLSTAIHIKLFQKAAIQKKLQLSRKQNGEANDGAAIIGDINNNNNSGIISSSSESDSDAFMETDNQSYHKFKKKTTKQPPRILNKRNGHNLLPNPIARAFAISQTSEDILIDSDDDDDFMTSEIVRLAEQTDVHNSNSKNCNSTTGNHDDCIAVIDSKKRKMRQIIIDDDDDDDDNNNNDSNDFLITSNGNSSNGKSPVVQEPNGRAILEVKEFGKVTTSTGSDTSIEMMTGDVIAGNRKLGQSDIDLSDTGNCNPQEALTPANDVSVIQSKQVDEDDHDVANEIPVMIPSTRSPPKKLERTENEWLELLMESESARTISSENSFLLPVALGHKDPSTNQQIENFNEDQKGVTETDMIDIIDHLSVILSRWSDVDLLHSVATNNNSYYNNNRPYEVDEDEGNSIGSQTTEATTASTTATSATGTTSLPAMSRSHVPKDTVGCESSSSSSWWECRKLHDHASCLSMASVEQFMNSTKSDIASLHKSDTTLMNANHQNSLSDNKNQNNDKNNNIKVLSEGLRKSIENERKTFIKESTKLESPSNMIAQDSFNNITTTTTTTVDNDKEDSKWDCQPPISKLSIFSPMKPSKYCKAFDSSHYCANISSKATLGGYLYSHLRQDVWKSVAKQLHHNEWMTIDFSLLPSFSYTFRLDLIPYLSIIIGIDSSIRSFEERKEEEMVGSSSLELFGRGCRRSRNSSSRKHIKQGHFAKTFGLQDDDECCLWIHRMGFISHDNVVI